MLILFSACDKKNYFGRSIVLVQFIDVCESINMGLTYVLSTKGRQKLLLHKYLYIHDWTRKGITRYKCEFAKELKCRAFVKIKDGKIDDMCETHASHVADVARIEAIKVKSKIMTKAIKTQDQPMQIVSKCTKKASRATKAALPTKRNLVKSVHRKRKTNDCAPAVPPSLAELELPDEYKETADGEIFLLYDSKNPDKRILIFSTKENLKLLRQCKTWIVDGTFDSAPPLFYQVLNFFIIIFYQNL